MIAPTAPVTTVAPPRWPAPFEAAILRRALTHARAEGWTRISEPKPAMEGAPKVYGAWGRGERDEDGFQPEWVAFPHDLRDVESEDLTGPGMVSNRCDGIKVAAFRQAVDLLFALDYLPATVSSGFHIGQEELAEAVHTCAEFGEAVHVFVDTATVDAVLADALTYWRDIATGTTAQAVISDGLGSLLDREPFVRRDQAEQVTVTVFDALAVDRG